MRQVVGKPGLGRGHGAGLEMVKTPPARWMAGVRGPQMAPG